ncbi:hypothetical protein [Pelomonas sp. KK5]|uniref:hypothetical protein n=1 Tax=Pelomonas sp. KK5 TaxID=1855730 RepID=UPI00097C0088|nr:hypothetical protein [Pelomonas sp. KK5]
MNDDKNTIEKILSLARWAPSGDNNQYWRFDPIDGLTVRVHGFDSRSHCVYDLDGHPSHISLGALLETIEIAASAESMAVDMQLDPSSVDTHPIYNLTFRRDPGMQPNPLAAVIEKRCVQRRPFTTRPLREDERQRLREAVGGRHELHLIEGFSQRLRTAKLMFHSAKLRLTIKEAYQVHAKIIEWDTRFSKDRIPDAALGASKMTLMMMRPAMKSWSRVQFLNRFLAGTWAPRIELDFLPGILCAAHFVVCAKEPPTTMQHYIEGGRALQSFWLTVTLLGLNLQPEVTPLVFTRYARQRRNFAPSAPDALRRADRVAERLGDLVGQRVSDCAVFMGRIGEGPAPTARSLRLDFKDLAHDPANEPH